MHQVLAGSPFFFLPADDTLHRTFASKHYTLATSSLSLWTMDQETLLEAKLLRNKIVGIQYNTMHKYKKQNDIDAKITKQRCTTENNEINKNVHFRIKFKTGCTKVMNMLWHKWTSTDSPCIQGKSYLLHSGEKLLDRHILLPWGIWTRCKKEKIGQLLAPSIQAQVSC